MKNRFGINQRFFSIKINVFCLSWCVFSKTLWAFIKKKKIWRRDLNFDVNHLNLMSTKDVFSKTTSRQAKRIDLILLEEKKRLNKRSELWYQPKMFFLQNIKTFRIHWSKSLKKKIWSRDLSFDVNHWSLMLTKDDFLTIQTIGWYYLQKSTKRKCWKLIKSKRNEIILNVSLDIDILQTTSMIRQRKNTRWSDNSIMIKEYLSICFGIQRRAFKTIDTTVSSPPPPPN